MSDCCQLGVSGAGSPRCPRCGLVGRSVDPLTPKALLTPEALARVSAPAHRFCPTPTCAVVYFGDTELFERHDVIVPVYQKEPPGERTLCYCFAIGEPEIRREIAEGGRSTAAERITAHVKAGRCACEIKNPQGSCCLGNVALEERRLQNARSDQTER